MVPAPRIRVTDGELPKGPGGGIRAYWDVQLVGPPSNLISCTGARLMEPSRAESGETARQIQGTAPALRRATRSHRTAPAGGAPLPGSWETREQTTMPPEHHRTCAGSPTLPIRKVTTPVPVEGGVAGGALAMSAGTSSRGAGSRRDRRASGGPLAVVQQAPQHWIRAMSPLKSWLVEKPQRLDADTDLVGGLADRIQRRDRAIDQGGETTNSGSADERAAKSTDAGAQQLCLPAETLQPT